MNILRNLLAISITVIIICACHPNPNQNNRFDCNTSKFKQPVNPNATKEAKELLDFLYRIQGKYILTGQHNYLGKMSVYTDSIYLLTGKYPAIWGSDFGFADSSHDIDNIKYRPLLIPEIKKQHQRGSIITMTYHQADPFVGEPCPFIGGVQTNPSRDQWLDILTKGTEANNTWKEYVDRLAEELKKLQELGIPVLFRPYHEMNGGWFWWGAHKGENGFVALWKILYHYYTDYHKLNNLIWVWSPDKPIFGLKEYYPGDAYVDVVSLDIYPTPDTLIVFRKEWYNDIKEIAGNRPFAIGECSTTPTLEELNDQNGYTWFMMWSDLGIKHNSAEKLREIFNSEKCLTADEVVQMRNKK